MRLKYLFTNRVCNIISTFFAVFGCIDTGEVKRC